MKHTVTPTDESTVALSEGNQPSTLGSKAGIHTCVTEPAFSKGVSLGRAGVRMG